MLKSMTGFGKATGIAKNKKVSIEIKSLNSKQLDLNIKVPSLYREKEIEIRNYLAEKLIRGKVDFSLQYDSGDEDKKVSINKPLALAYYRELKELASELDNRENINYLNSILSLPDVLQSDKPEIDDEEWERIKELIAEATLAINDFRSAEGAQLEKDITERIGYINQYREQVKEYLPERLVSVKERIEKNMKDNISEESVDKNRLEQELIYYLEKLDITEENIRLESHCNYFTTTVNEEDTQGKKLGFILQEIGREINTMGSKASHVAIQKLVVQMKDELEKIKEQVLNVV